MIRESRWAHSHPIDNEDLYSHPMYLQVWFSNRRARLRKTLNSASAAATAGFAASSAAMAAAASQYSQSPTAAASAAALASMEASAQHPAAAAAAYHQVWKKNFLEHQRHIIKKEDEMSSLRHKQI